jgi:hypothetical protein
MDFKIRMRISFTDRSSGGQAGDAMLVVKTMSAAALHIEQP